MSSVIANLKRNVQSAVENFKAVNHTGNAKQIKLAKDELKRAKDALQEALKERKNKD